MHGNPLHLRPSPQAEFTQLQAGSGATVHHHHRQSLHNYKPGVALQFTITTGRVYTTTSREWCYSSPSPQAEFTQLQAGSGATVHHHHRQSLHNYSLGVVLQFTITTGRVYTITSREWCYSSPSPQAEFTQLQAGSGATVHHHHRQSSHNYSLGVVQ